MNEESLFAAALEKATLAERRAFLDEVCAVDDGLRRRVQCLLAADEQAGGVLDRDASRELTSTLVAGAPGTVIGPYKLKEQIGEGGFGLVYVAEQHHPVRRSVALKIIKPGLETREVIGRFEAERQTLALMDHPNIARVFDAGVSDSGRPYFVMELVRGVSITAYCDHHQFTTRERLELFISVCQAVQHAHQKGIIHRDIKPSNVLVERHDDRSTVKVIDFGVAKALNGQLSEHSIYTRFAQMIGTPLYMSPEQAEMSGLDVDTRADIYSLGLLLYELLTGTTPFDRERLRTVGFDEMRRIIREEDPPKPSTRLSTLGQGATTVSVSRRTNLKRLGRSIRGELDWIVMKALEKDRTRRYETAAELARDVQRYMRDEPVEALPPSRIYRLRKFLRRNRGPVLTMSVIFFLLICGTIGTTIGLARAEARADGERQAKLEAEQSAALEREARLAAERAERAARESDADTRAFSEFLVNDVLSVARPAGIRGGMGIDVTMRQALVAAQERIGSTFEGRPRAEAVARHDLGVTFRLIGEARLAEPHLRRAVALRQQELGPDHEDTLSSQNSLGLLLSALGKHAEAVSLLEETLERRDTKSGRDHPATLVSMDNLASARRAAGKLELAIPLYKETLERRTAVLGPNHQQTLATMNGLARSYHSAKKLGQAIPLYEETLKRTQAVLRPDHPLTLSITNNLAACYYSAGKIDLALPLFERVFELQKETLGPNHPDTITSMSNIASCHQAARRLDRAVPLYEEVLRLQRLKLDPDHPDTILSLYNLALAYRNQGEPDRAVPLFEEAASAVEKGGFKHEYSEQMVRRLIDCHEGMGQYDRAEVWRRKWLPVIGRKFGLDHVSYAHDLALLATNLLAQKKFAEAEPVLRDCLSIRENKWKGSWLTFNARSLLGAALAGQKKYAEAEPLLLSGYKSMKQVEGTIPVQLRDERLREALQRLVQLYEDWGKPAEAARCRMDLDSR